VIRHLALILIICALIVPRVMWGAHEAGHDQPVIAMVEHVHHDGHTHEVAVDDHGDELPGDGDHDGKVAHNHQAADVLSSIASIDGHHTSESQLAFAALHLLDRGRTIAPAAHPDSLLRPPRAA